MSRPLHHCGRRRCPESGLPGGDSAERVVRGSRGRGWPLRPVFPPATLYARLLRPIFSGPNWNPSAGAGTATISTEMEAASPDLRAYVGQAVRTLLGEPRFARCTARLSSARRIEPGAHRTAFR